MSGGNIGNVDMSKGAIIFRQRCESCHTFVPGERPGEDHGPNLHKVFGRKVAQSNADSNYSYYSLASQYKDITWNEENLMQFLEEPKKFIPGTKMLFKGLKNVSDRRDLISYLKEVTK